ncbi:MAG: hypothetical protein AAF466_07830 [Bacteroidota bacterium]
MNKALTVFLLFFCFISEAFAQKSLSDYSFVIVPEKFDFVDEKDKYQLNSLTKFLFNKHGFNAYYQNELPDVNRCEGLYAEVDGKPSIIRTKVTVILKDCYGDEVYRTAVGKSKIKAYNKTYTAALRQAFMSFDSLGINQNEPMVDDRVEVTPEPVETSPPVATTEVVEETPVTSNETVTLRSDETLYRQDDAEFVLKSTNIGYMLSEKTEKGMVVKGQIALQAEYPCTFKDANGNQFPCYFDKEKNLIIETSFQELKFTKVDQ